MCNFILPPVQTKWINDNFNDINYNILIPINQYYNDRSSISNNILVLSQSPEKIKNLTKDLALGYDSELEDSHLDSM